MTTTKNTIVILRQLSADEKVRQEAYYREKALHDEASVPESAMRKGRAEDISESMSKGKVEHHHELTQMWHEMGMTEEQIKKLLGK